MNADTLTAGDTVTLHNVTLADGTTAPTATVTSVTPAAYRGWVGARFTALKEDGSTHEGWVPAVPHRRVRNA